MITKDQITSVQNRWAQAIIDIGKYKTYSEECSAFTNNLLNGLYDFSAPILFKPTKAAAAPFRSSLEAAKSYFIGSNSQFAEDKGFALNPWVNVRFDNDQIKIKQDSALAMGHYYFTDPDRNEVKVEYTFGYTLKDGLLKIDLHHSSLPYSQN